MKTSFRQTQVRSLAFSAYLTVSFVACSSDDGEEGLDGGSSSGGDEAGAGGGAASGGSTSETADTGGADPGSGGANIGTGGTLGTGGTPGGDMGTGGDEATGGEAGTGGDAGTGGSVGNGSQLVGWAATPACGPNGTTGGEGGEEVTVSSGSELRDALASSGPKIIHVSGDIDSWGSLDGVQDKTVIGGSGGVHIHGGVRMNGANNVIFKNVIFDGESSGDTLELSSGSSCIWFDHCDFRDGGDGNLDIVRGSDLITVSWSKFYYTSGHGHMLSNLCGNSNDRSEDEGKINLTFHHNWWGAGVRSRMPRIRYGKVHVFNNYYHYTPVDGDGGHVSTVAAGQHSKLVVENNYFEGSKGPIIFQSDEGTAEVVHNGNEFDGTDGSPVSRGESFEPPYEYEGILESAIDARASVIAGAGVQ